MDDLLTSVQAKEKFKGILAEWQIQQEEWIERAFHFAQSEFLLSYEQLTHHLSFSNPFVLTYVSKVAVIPLGPNFIVKAIYSDAEQEDLKQLEQQLRNFIEQKELHHCTNCIEVYRFYVLLVQQLYSKKVAHRILTESTSRAMKTNRKSLPIKQIHLQYIVYLFSVQSIYVQREINLFDKRWSLGKWALNEKEQVLLLYMKMHLAARKKRWTKVAMHAGYLLKDDLLASYAVELMVDYGALLPSYSTDPTVFVKSFKNHYLEYTCYFLVEALDHLKAYERMMQLMKVEPIVSCVLLHTYLQTGNHDDLIRVEAVIQQNIGLLVDGHHSNVRASIQKWQQLRQQQSWEANELVIHLSDHLCRLLKACFITGHFIVFEKLMAMYVKYFYVERHYIGLKESLRSKMDVMTVVEMK